MGVTFRVREYSRPVKKDQPLHDGMNPYWVYCSNDFDDYYEAIKYAIAEEKRTGIKNWVDLMNYNPEYPW